MWPQNCSFQDKGQLRVDFCSKSYFHRKHTKRLLAKIYYSQQSKVSIFLRLVQNACRNWAIAHGVTLLHTGLTCSRSIQNYAFKGWLSLQTMKLWLLVLTKTPFVVTLIIKLTLGNIFIKVKNPPGGATVKKQSKQILKLWYLHYWCAPRGPRGVKRRTRIH